MDLTKLDEDQKDLIHELFEDEEVMLSIFLIDHLKPVVLKGHSTEVRIDLLKEFRKFLSTIINCLGWIEHTHDYDPYLEIHLESGDLIKTESGYYLFEIEDDFLVMDSGETQLRIHVEDIYSIILCR